MGLPGSGKTWLAKRLQERMKSAWFNADAVRKMANDWEFGDDARLRQARRMRNLADYEKNVGRTVICDFVCPTKATRDIFAADYTVWMDTIKEGRFEDTNAIFEDPDDYDYHVSQWFDNTDETLVRAIYRHIENQKNEI